MKKLIVFLLVVSLVLSFGCTAFTLSGLPTTVSSTDTPAPVPTFVPISTLAPVPTSTPTCTPTLTATSTPIPTNTPAPAPTFVPTNTPVAVGEKRIVIDLSEQMLYAYEADGQLFLEILVSTGTVWTPTPKGTYHILRKKLATHMSGPGYSLPNVPFTMYFYRSYAIHGTYWHNNFGNQMSHGCVNLPTDMAEQLFYWAGPVLPEGEIEVSATAENPGTLVVIVE